MSELALKSFFNWLSFLCGYFLVYDIAFPLAIQLLFVCFSFSAIQSSLRQTILLYTWYNNHTAPSYKNWTELVWEMTKRQNMAKRIISSVSVWLYHFSRSLLLLLFNNKSDEKNTNKTKIIINFRDFDIMPGGFV